MNIKKIGYIILLVILGTFVFSIYNSFNGNPVSKFASKKTLEKYLEETYPNREFRITNGGSYNFKFGQYSFDTVEIGVVDEKKGSAREHRFSVSGFIKFRVAIDPIREENIDTALSERLNKEASKEIEDLLIKYYPSVKEVSTNIEVLKGENDPNVVWSNNLKLDRPLSLHILLEVKNETKDEMLLMAQKIQEIINSNEYIYSNVTINANILNNSDNFKDQYGYVKYAVSFEKDTKLSVKDVKDLSKKEL